MSQSTLASFITTPSKKNKKNDKAHSATATTQADGISATPHAPSLAPASSTPPRADTAEAGLTPSGPLSLRPTATPFTPHTPLATSNPFAAIGVDDSAQHFPPLQRSAPTAPQTARLAPSAAVDSASPTGPAQQSADSTEHKASSSPSLSTSLPDDDAEMAAAAEGDNDAEMTAATNKRKRDDKAEKEPAHSAAAHSTASSSSSNGSSGAHSSTRSQRTAAGPTDVAVSAGVLSALGVAVTTAIPASNTRPPTGGHQLQPARLRSSTATHQRRPTLDPATNTCPLRPNAALRPAGGQQQR